MSTDEHFDNVLWPQLKERIVAARSKEYDVERVYTDGVRFGDMLAVNQPDEGQCRISAHTSSGSCTARMTRDGLIAHAANCIAAAMDIDEAGAKQQAA